MTNFTISLLKVDPAKALLLISLNPLWAALMGKLLLNDPLPMRKGCDCSKEESQFAHVACMIKVADMFSPGKWSDKWEQCPTCKSGYSGIFHLRMARESMRHPTVTGMAEDDPMRPRVLRNLAQAYSTCGRFAQAESVFRDYAALSKRWVTLTPFLELCGFAS